MIHERGPACQIAYLFRSDTRMGAGTSGGVVALAGERLDLTSEAFCDKLISCGWLAGLCSRLPCVPGRVPIDDCIYKYALREHPVVFPAKARFWGSSVVIVFLCGGQYESQCVAPRRGAAFASCMSPKFVSGILNSAGRWVHLQLAPVRVGAANGTAEGFRFLLRSGCA